MVYKKAHEGSAAEVLNSSGNTQPEGFSRSFAQKYRNMTHEECVDAILDKINEQGYDSLSDEEKAFLQKSSKKK